MKVCEPNSAEEKSSRHRAGLPISAVEILAAAEPKGHRRESRAAGQQTARSYRKMSFGHPEEEDEVRSVAASSYGHEFNSNSSDASCDQSDISLEDDGGSEEEEGEGNGILGHL